MTRFSCYLTFRNLIHLQLSPDMKTRRNWKMFGKLSRFILTLNITSKFYIIINLLNYNFILIIRIQSTIRVVDIVAK